MKKLLFILSATIALSAFAFSGCVKNDNAENNDTAPLNTEEKTQENGEWHSDFRFLPKRLDGNAVEYEGEIYIIRIGNRKDRPEPQKPALPDCPEPQKPAIPDKN